MISFAYKHLLNVKTNGAASPAFRPSDKQHKKLAIFLV